MDTEDIYQPIFVQNLFDKMSISYERMNYITSFGFSLRWRRQFIRMFEKSSEPVKIIDLLTGMGETWKPIKKKFPKAHFSALDFSQGMLTYAKHKNEHSFNNEITVLQQDVLQSKLGDNEYDFVTCAFGLKTFNLQQIEQLAQEVKRILKVGGQCSFIEVSTPRNGILKALYGLHLGKIVPFMGRILLGNPVEYRMLWKYTQKFNNVNPVIEIFKSTGLVVTPMSYFYGCATGFVGKKLS